MPRYQRRIVDVELDELLPGVAAIAIEGARAVGKTTTALERAATIYRLDDPGILATIEGGPERVVRGRRPILIDEWQLVPEVWDLVRRAVDTDGEAGQFILTGSASPKRRPTHSGAGRIVSLRMRPMTLAERGLATPTVSLAQLIRGDPSTIDGETDVSLEGYANEILASGFPGFRGRSERSVRAELDAYIARVIDHDFEDLGGERVRNDAALRRWLRAYASAVSSTASYEKIRDAATAGNDEKPSRPTVQRYLDVLERMWLIEPVPAWIPERNLMSRLAQAPKHQLSDPALAARLRGATVDTLLSGASAGPLAPRDATLFGALFESVVTADVRVYAQAAEARVGHFRTRNGDREVDVIVERADGRVVAIEVKLTSVVKDEHVRHLTWLRDRMGTGLLDAIVISTGRYAYRRGDGIGVVPASLLGA